MNSQNELRVIVGMVSDIGCRRPNNEDFALYEIPAPDSIHSRKGVLAIVADGMGGHAGGEVASRLAAEVVRRTYYEAPVPPAEALRLGFVEANRVIREAVRRYPALVGMGTTCTALAICDGEVFSAHVGDSRLYLVRDGGIYQMTEDDSEVMERARRGILSREEAARHPDKNVILKALGTHAKVEPAVWEKPIRGRDGDRFLLSSDGLHDLVTDAEIFNTVTGHTPDDACAALVALAKSRGGHDNVTVGVLFLALEAAVTKKAVRETREVTVVS